MSGGRLGSPDQRRKVCAYSNQPLRLTALSTAAIMSCRLVLKSDVEVRDIRIGLTPRAVEVLSALPRNADEPRVFPITVSLISSAFKRARARAKVEHFRLHDARHERTSSLIEAGWSDTEVMAQTGHLDHKSLKRYANLRESFLADKLAQLPSRTRRSSPDVDEA